RRPSGCPSPGRSGSPGPRSRLGWPRESCETRSLSSAAQHRRFVRSLEGVPKELANRLLVRTSGPGHLRLDLPKKGFPVGVPVQEEAVEGVNQAEDRERRV